ncbi:MAG: hypothetical protein Sw1PiTSA_25620 [Shewanella algae]|nr:hypothetical protein TUM4442_20330 [Shewanella algae]
MTAMDPGLNSVCRVRWLMDFPVGKGPCLCSMIPWPEKVSNMQKVGLDLQKYHAVEVVTLPVGMKRQEQEETQI